MCKVRLCHGMKSLSLLCLEGLKCSYFSEVAVPTPVEYKCASGDNKAHKTADKSSEFKTDFCLVPVVPPVCHPAACGDGSVLGFGPIK